MMGKGKSSVITPLLYLYLYSNGNKNKINIVLPISLIKQAYEQNYLLKEIFNIPIRIIDVNQAKLEYIGNNQENGNLGIDKSDNVYIFDEFDSMYDPISSNFNFILK